MDFTSLLGVLMVLVVLVNALTGYAEDAYQGALLLLVGLGGLGATLIAIRMGDLTRLLQLPFKALFAREPDLQGLVARIVGYAETARREGILALEKAVNTENSPFMNTGIRLAVDGTEPELIQTIMQTELAFIRDRHRRGQDVMKILATCWMSFGSIAALGVLSIRTGYVGGIDALEESTLALLYGVLLGGMVLAMRWKLQIVSDMETLQKHMMQEGVLSIQSGDNPRIIEHKLNVFLAPNLRQKSAPPKTETAPKEKAPAPEPPPVDPDFQAQVQDIITKLKAALPDELSERPDAWTLDELLNLTEDSTRREILKSIGEPEAPPLLPSYDVEIITRLADREVQLLLREVNVRDIVIALKGASEAVRERIFANVSERVGTMIKEEMNAKRMQSLPVRRVVDMQLRMLRILQLLQEKNMVTKNP